MQKLPCRHLRWHAPLLKLRTHTHTRRTAVADVHVASATAPGDQPSQPVQRGLAPLVASMQLVIAALQRLCQEAKGNCPSLREACGVLTTAVELGNTLPSAMSHAKESSVSPSFAS